MKCLMLARQEVVLRFQIQQRPTISGSISDECQSMVCRAQSYCTPVFQKSSLLDSDRIASFQVHREFLCCDLKSVRQFIDFANFISWLRSLLLSFLSSICTLASGKSAGTNVQGVLQTGRPHLKSTVCCAWLERIRSRASRRLQLNCRSRCLKPSFAHFQFQFRFREAAVQERFQQLQSNWWRGQQQLTVRIASRNLISLMKSQPCFRWLVCHCSPAPHCASCAGVCGEERAAELSAGTLECLAVIHDLVYPYLSREPFLYFFEL